jgi:hypothetical protein
MEWVPSYILADYTRNLALPSSGWSTGPNNSFEHWTFKRGNISLSVRLIEYKNERVVFSETYGRQGSIAYDLCIGGRR